MKEIEQCAFLAIPKQKLSKCIQEAWAWCQGGHTAKTWFCFEHLQQCRDCGKILCLECSKTHKEVCEW